MFNLWRDRDKHVEICKLDCTVYNCITASFNISVLHEQVQLVRATIAEAQ